MHQHGRNRKHAVYVWLVTHQSLDRSTRAAACRPLVPLRAAAPNKTKRGRTEREKPLACKAGPMEREGRYAAEKPLLVRVVGSGSGDSQGGSASSSSVAVVVGCTAIAVAGSFEFGISVSPAFNSLFFSTRDKSHFH